MATPTTEKIDSIEKSMMHAALLARALEGQKKPGTVTIQKSTLGFYNEKGEYDKDCQLVAAVDNVIKTLPPEVTAETRASIKTTLDSHFNAVINDLKDGRGLKNSENWTNMQASVLNTLSSGGVDHTQPGYNDFNKNLKELLTKDNNQKLAEEMERLNRDMQTKKELNTLIMLQEGMLGYIKASTTDFGRIDEEKEKVNDPDKDKPGASATGSPINKELKTGYYRDKSDPKAPILHFDEKTGTARPINVLDKEAWRATIKFMAQRHSSLTLNAVDKDTLKMLINFALDEGREIKLSVEAQAVITKMLASDEKGTEELLNKIRENNKAIEEAKGAELVNAEKVLYREFLDGIWNKAALKDKIADLETVSKVRDPGFNDGSEPVDLKADMKMFMEAVKTLNELTTTLKDKVSIDELAQSNSGFDEQYDKIKTLAGTIEKVAEALKKDPGITDDQKKEVDSAVIQTAQSKDKIDTRNTTIVDRRAELEAEKVKAHAPGRT